MNETETTPWLMRDVRESLESQFIHTCTIQSCITSLGKPLESDYFEEDDVLFDFIDFNELHNHITTKEATMIYKVNQKTNIQPETNGTKKLSYQLCLAKKNLTELPTDFPTYHRNLKTLLLDDNQFTEFPKEVCSLPQLQALSLNNNMIACIPEDIAHLNHLERLELNTNALTTIDPAIKNLNELRQLTLSKNRLSHWPREICGLTKLLTLHIHGNAEISSIPCEFASLVELVECGFDWFLYLSHSSNSVLQSSEKVQLIGSIRDCCKYYARNSIKQVNFVEFVSWISKLRKHKLMNFVYSKGRNPLHIASIWGHIEIVKQIAEEKLNLNVCDDAGESALLLALKYDQFEVAELLIKSDKADVTVKCGRYGSILNFLITTGKYELAIEVGKRYNPTVELTDDNGNNVFHYLLANFSSNPVDSKIIFDIMVKKQPECMNAHNNTDMAPLHCAAMKNQVEAIRCVILHNKASMNRFDFNDKGGKYGFTVLHFIAVYMNLETMLYVLSNAEVDIFEVDKAGCSARQIVKNTLGGKLLLRYEKDLISRRISKKLNSRTSKPIGTSAMTKKKLFKEVTTSGCSARKDVSDSTQEEKLYTLRGESKANAIPGIIASYQNAEFILKQEEPLTVNRIRSFAVRNTLYTERKKASDLNIDPKEKLYKNSGQTMNEVFSHLTKCCRGSRKKGKSSLGCKYNKSESKYLVFTENDRAKEGSRFLEKYDRLIDANIQNYEKCAIIYSSFKDSMLDAELTLNFLLDKSPSCYLMTEIIYLLGFAKNAKKKNNLDGEKRLAIFIEFINAAMKGEVQLVTRRNTAIKVKKCSVVDESFLIS